MEPITNLCWESMVVQQVFRKFVVPLSEMSPRLDQSIDERQLSFWDVCRGAATFGTAPSSSKLWPLAAAHEAIVTRCRLELAIQEQSNEVGDEVLGFVRQLTESWCEVREDCKGFSLFTTACCPSPTYRRNSSSPCSPSLTTSEYARLDWKVTSIFEI